MHKVSPVCTYVAYEAMWFSYFQIVTLPFFEPFPLLVILTYLSISFNSHL